MKPGKWSLSEFVGAIKDALRRFTDFAGTSTISQFWYYILAIAMCSGVAGIIAGDLGQNIFSALTLLPTLAVGVRRMHEVGKSGWFILVPIYNIVLWASPSKMTVEPR